MFFTGTNHPSELDEAILCSFSRAFEIGTPDQRERAEILKVILKDERVEDDIDFDSLTTLESCEMELLVFVYRTLQKSYVSSDRWPFPGFSFLESELPISFLSDMNMEGPESKSASGNLGTQRGGCHYEKDRQESQSGLRLVIHNGDFHFRALLAGKSNIRPYTFDIHIARHIFSSVCGFTIFYSPRSNGITNFYTSRSNPDGIIVTRACICPGTVTHIEILSFDGHSWEDSYAQSGVALLCRRWLANMVHGLQQAQEKSLFLLAPPSFYRINYCQNNAITEFDAAMTLAEASVVACFPLVCEWLWSPEAFCRFDLSSEIFMILPVFDLGFQTK
ncbi:hypothetical protein Cgig2_019334 [Carnegiea gigantea]|uniref:Uncharacterized protein n=1 Tax=Carnegiea gigantea TaxID=171969 RepID=A0A9Q1KL37_9CARY|nr:hypothetical protein Cgig2_019334 [Carnegiea gigantea]